MIDLLIVMLVAVSDVVSGRSFVSPAAARALVVSLQNEPLDAFAAPDPDRPGRFVAVLYVGDQLLVVETTHESPARIADLIAAQRYRDVYFNLRGTRGLKKFVVQDAAADGLLTLPSAHGSVDVIYEDGARALRFNGDPRAQGLTEGDYNARFEAADVEYGRMLTTLVRALEYRRLGPT